MAVVTVDRQQVTDNRLTTWICRVARLIACWSLVSPGLAGAEPGDLLGTFDSAAARFEVTVVADDLSIPWGLAFLPDGRILVTERRGRMNIIDPASGNSNHLEGLPPVAHGGQGGLLDVVLHPDYEQNGWIYFSYSAKVRRKRTTRVARARLTDHKLTGLEVLFTAEPYFGTRHHFGSRLVLDRQGYLFVTVGDRRNRHEAQALRSHMGKVIRLHDDGHVPESNPFAGQAGARAEIYSYGHRNPQGLALHPETGELWEHEHGPRGGVEVNFIYPGRNYGCQVIT